MVSVRPLTSIPSRVYSKNSLRIIKNIFIFKEQTAGKSPSLGWVMGFCARMSSEDQHSHATTYTPYVQALDWYILITQITPEPSNFSDHETPQIFVVSESSTW